MEERNRLECQHCGMSFDSREELDQHNRQQHPGQTRDTGGSPGRKSESSSPRREDRPGQERRT